MSADWRSGVKPVFGAHGLALGMRFVDAGDDWAEYALDYHDTLVASAGDDVIASSAIVTLMDNACGMALRRRTDGAEASATLSLRIDYLRPLRSRSGVVGRATCYHLSERIAVLRGTAHDGNPDDPVAHVIGSFMFTDAP